MAMQNVTRSYIQEPLIHAQKEKKPEEVSADIETISVSDEIKGIFDLVPDNPLLHFLYSETKWAGQRVDILAELNRELIEAAKGGFLKNKALAVKKALSKNIGSKWRFDTKDVDLVLAAFEQRNLREHIHNPALRAVIANRGLALTGRQVRQFNRAKSFQEIEDHPLFRDVTISAAEERRIKDALEELKLEKKQAGWLLRKVANGGRKLTAKKPKVPSIPEITLSFRDARFKELDEYHSAVDHISFHLGAKDMEQVKLGLERADKVVGKFIRKFNVLDPQSSEKIVEPFIMLNRYLHEVCSEISQQPKIKSTEYISNFGNIYKVLDRIKSNVFQVCDLKGSYEPKLGNVDQALMDFVRGSDFKGLKEGQAPAEVVKASETRKEV